MPQASDADALVVGSGPNGLAAAVTLAQAGLSVTVLEAADTIGGGTRTRELAVPGVLHDICSAVHPFGIISPYLTTLPLAEHGLEWRWPEIDLAHPLDGGRAAVFVRSLEETAAGLGVDGAAWRRTFAPLVDQFGALADDVLGPMLQVPRHPITLGRFGVRAMLPATLLARRFKTDEARALFGGNAGHVIHPLNRPATAAAGLMLIAAGHKAGWPVAAGGSQAIATALASLLTELGGKVETGTPVTSLAELPPTRLVLFDTSPSALVDIAGDRLPPRTRRAFTRWRYGPAAYKIDLAVENGVPWTAEACRAAGTVHVGGTLEEIAAAEAEVHRGRMPEHPFVLVAQQYLCDPQRSVGEVHPVWCYAHVPNGYTGDAADAILGQLERFAPGTRERIVASHVTSPAAFARYNPNYVGGDISTGANDLRQLILRPRLALDPYATGIPGVYLCSAATPPGAGVHGMCGHHAAKHALHHLRLASGPTAA
ncbi:MAG TPA: NAD(P)/FAD-dependent oxidoreductase [Acidimicrobiales bacterium]